MSDFVILRHQLHSSELVTVFSAGDLFVSAGYSQLLMNRSEEFQCEVFWVVTQCSIVVGVGLKYHRRESLKTRKCFEEICVEWRLKWIATLPLGDINTEAWSSGVGVGRGG
jgi:hypothetical protein